MALIICKECNKEISDKTTNCIHCGCPTKDNEYSETSSELIFTYKNTAIDMQKLIKKHGDNKRGAIKEVLKRTKLPFYDDAKKAVEAAYLGKAYVVDVKKIKINKIILNIIILMSVVPFIACIVLISNDINTHPPIDNINETPNYHKEEIQEQVHKIDYKKLFNDYEENAINADSVYKGKLLMVTGKVDNIYREITGEPYITFNIGGEYSFKTIRLTFKKSEESSVANLKKGQTVDIVGRCAGSLMGVSISLTDCYLTK